MSKFNALATDPKKQKFIKDWVKRKPPLIYVYAPTGEGKTHLAGDLLDHKVEGLRPYAPVLWIDGDEGNETVGEYAENPELCTLIEYDGKYDGKLNWFYEKLDAAEKAKCGAIVIEGLNALFKSLLSPELRKLASIKGVELWTAHNEPSQHMDNVFEAIKKLKINRRFAGRGVPIYVTMNVREVSKDPNDASLGKMFIPNFSNNRIRAAMGTSDAFIELQRPGSRTKMLCKRDPYNKFRKLRRASVADKVEATTNLSLPGLIGIWAVEAARAKKTLDKKLAEEFATLEAEDNAANSETQAPDTEGDS